MVAFHEWAKNVEEHTGGKIKVKFFAGGTAGDERDAVRKMRLGQLNGAAVTAIGLGLINSEVRVLELPMLINSYDELDYVRNKLDADLRKKFDDKGYVLLAWGDVGPVHIFSNTPIRGKADLAQLKLWAWVDDALVRALFQQLGVNGVPLGVPDVLPSLADGPHQRLLRLAAVDAGAAVVHQGQVHDLDAHLAGHRRHRHHQEGVREARPGDAEDADGRLARPSRPSCSRRCARRTRRR